MAIIMVALPRPEDPDLAKMLRMRIPGAVGEQYWTCEPIEADDQNPLVIRALSRGDLVKVEG